MSADDPNRPQPISALLGAAVALFVSVAVAADGSTVPYEDPAALGRWLTAVGAVEAVLAAATLTVAVGSAYVVAVAGLAALADVCCSPVLTRAATAIAVAPLRRALRLGSAGGLAAALLLPTTATAGPDPGSTPPTTSGAPALVLLDSPAPPVTTTVPTGPRFELLAESAGPDPRNARRPSGPPSTPSDEPPARVPDEDRDRVPGGRGSPPIPSAASPSPLPDAAASTAERDRPTAVTPGPGPGRSGSTDGCWTIRPGEHLWRVAEVMVGSGGGDRPDIASVARYHQRLIAANADRLPVPGNADLVFPGTVLTCPPPT